MLLRLSRKYLTIVAVCLCALPVVSVASAAWAAAIVAKVDLSRQRMEVFVDGRSMYKWTVSTGREGWHTPPGTYYPFALTRHFYSEKWKMNLPYLVSISSDGIAIHGTELTAKLGRPASHGCIRLSIGNAARFYGLVAKHGMNNTTVVVTH